MSKGEARTRFKKNKATEAQTQKLILDWLAAEGIWSMRINTGAMAAEHNGRKRFVRFATPGCADILAIKEVAVSSDEPYFMPHWLEIKSPTGKQSEAQVAFEREVTDHGHVYAVCRSLDDVKQALGMA